MQAVDTYFADVARHRQLPWQAWQGRHSEPDNLRPCQQQEVPSVEPEEPQAPVGACVRGDDAVFPVAADTPSRAVAVLDQPGHVAPADDPLR